MDDSALRDLKITAYHEASHIVVAQIIGKRIKTICIILSHTEPVQVLGGKAGHDPNSSIDKKWISLDLDRFIPFDELPPASPDDEFKNDRDNCAITCAGWVAEVVLCEHLGREESTVQSDETNRDKKKAWELMQRFPLDEQEKELLNAEARARHILNNPICWSCPVPAILNTITRRGIGSNGYETEELYARVQTQSGVGKYAAGYHARGSVQEIRDRQLDVASLEKRV